MCRSTTSDGEGRRCPCDSSAARLSRRSNAAMKTAYAEQLSVPTASNALPSLIDTQTVTAEEVKQDINHLNTLFVTEGASDADIDAAVIKVGEGISTLAEKEHGAPSDEDFANLMSSEQVEASQLHKVSVDSTKEFEDLYPKYRKEIGLGEPMFKSAMFARIEELSEKGLPEEKVEELRAIKTRKEDAINRVNKLRENIDPSEYDDKRVEALKKRNEGMRAALESVGVELADSKTFEYSDTSNKKAVAAVQSAVPFYPQSWVDASNVRQTNGRPLVIKMSKSRAHYGESIRQNTRTMGPAVSTRVMEKDWKPSKSQEDEYVQATHDGEGKFTNPISGKKIDADPEQHSVWVRRYFDHSYDDRKPSGRNWEKYSDVHKNYNYDTKEWENEDRERWRRPKQVMTSRSSTVTAELTINAETSKMSDTVGHRIGIHELAHRFEGTLPEVVRAESAFLDRRRGAGTDEEEGLSKIYSAGQEKGYKDNFHTHYMGKLYPNGRNYELLSVGMESVFSGSQSGLTHNASTYLAPDDDYRKFVLGSLTIRPRTT